MELLKGLKGHNRGFKPLESALPDAEPDEAR